MSTNANVRQLTDGAAKSQHLYFTSPSVSQDGRWLVLISERTGSPNLFAMNRHTGETRQLSDNQAGLLRAYCYPQGGERGLSKASPSFDPYRRRVYYIQDDGVVAADLDSGERRRLWAIPDRWWTAFTHVSHDGRWLCVPCTDPAAFDPDDETQWHQLERVPGRMKERQLHSRVYLLDTLTGDAELFDELPFWVTHVNINPTSSDRIAVNSEGYRHTIPEWSDRIYCLERGRRWRPLFAQRAGVTVTHENWSPDGRHLIFHGVMMVSGEKRHYLAARRWDGSLVFEYQLGTVPIAHATPGEHDRALIADTRDGWIVRIEVDDDGQSHVRRLCRHNSDYADQDAHPHPVLNPSGEGIVFTSSESGTCQVYELKLAAIPASVTTL